MAKKLVRPVPNGVVGRVQRQLRMRNPPSETTGGGTVTAPTTGRGYPLK